MQITSCLEGELSLFNLQPYLNSRLSMQDFFASLRHTLTRVREALRRQPSLGKGTGRSTTEWHSGLKCEIREGTFTLRADMPESVGGTASAPTPGVLGRAALGSCLAIGYVMQAATLQIPIRSLTVQIETDYDDGGFLGASQAEPGYSEVRYTVVIDSDADEARLTEMLDRADARSPLLDVFRRPQRCVRQLQLQRS